MTVSEIYLEQITKNTATLASGTSNVDITGNSIGLATNANIDALEITLSTLLTAILANEKHKLNRIQGASNYASVITYVGATTNVSTITHTGTTDLGAETLIATYAYDGSNRLTNITYS